MTACGMLVRADHRGLSTMTGLLARHLQPDRVLLVDMGKHSPTALHPEQYPDRWGTVAYDELLAGSYDWGPFLDGVDVVYTAETPYDYRLFAEGAKRGVRTILHVMPELCPYVRQPDLPRPDVIALPTSWMSERYPDSPILPVPSDPWEPQRGDLVVHPAALAMRDRNGTRTVIDASVFTARPVVVRGQAAPDQPWKRATVEVADRERSADLYDAAGLVVIPRRYGGLSMTLQEAMSAGLPVLVSEADVYAHHLPAEARLRAIRGRDLQAKGGAVKVWGCEPREVAERIDLVMGDPELRGQLEAASRRWAEANAWPLVKPMWDAVLERVPDQGPDGEAGTDRVAESVAIGGFRNTTSQEPAL